MENIFKEVAFVAYHFHWDRETVLGMSHKERHAWVKEISKNHEEPPDVRAKGREILKLLEHAPPRTERRVGEP